MNDLQITEWLLEVKAAHRLACDHIREGRLNSALSEVARIEDAARKAGWRLNDLLRPRPTTGES